MKINPWTGLPESNSDSAPVTLPASGNVAIDAKDSDKFILLPTGAINLSLDNFTDNKEVILKIENGASLISWPSFLKWDNSNSSEPPILITYGYDLVRIIKISDDGKFIAEHVGAYNLMPETSYSNTGGTGDRTSLIAITYGGGWYRTNPVLNMVDGNKSSFAGLNTVNTSGCHITFDFGSQKFIDEMRFYCYGDIYTHGNWVVVGSDDGVTWSDPLSPETELAATQVIPAVFSMSANSASYRYYRMLGVSGQVNGNDYFCEAEFKISE